MVEFNRIAGQDGKIDTQEWNQWLDDYNRKNPDSKEDDKIQIMRDGQPIILRFGDLQKGTIPSQLLSQAAEATTPNAAQADAALKNAKTVMENLSRQIAETNDKSQREQLQKQLAEQIIQAERWNNVASKKLDLSNFINQAGPAYQQQKTMSGKAQVGFQFPGANGTSGPKAQSAGGGTTQTKGFTAPAGWGASAFGGTVPKFNTASYMNAMAVEDNVMSSWDAVNKNTSKGKQLMMLFFYFARMAESGDMGAMYQFMKFITYVISKDKAKQQIEMGKKLIQLQELSRSWTNKLMDVQTNTNDASASNELMKTMTIVKSETDAIATSQKLISQMMEEFAQVVENLTNVTKASLDTHGRILRTVSQMR